MDGIVRIDRVVAQLEAWLDASFPFAKLKIKILERSPSDFLAVANVAVRNVASRHPEFTGGLGRTIDEALDDLLTRFVADVRANTPATGLTEADFEWSSTEDF